MQIWIVPVEMYSQTLIQLLAIRIEAASSVIALLRFPSYRGNTWASELTKLFSGGTIVALDGFEATRTRDFPTELIETIVCHPPLRHLIHSSP